jgi:hypothetical protein
VRDATSTDIAVYNAFVTTAANLDAGLAGLGTTWTVLGSTAAVNVLDNTGLSAADTTARFYNTAGSLIAAGVTVPTTGLYGGATTAHVATILTEIGSATNDSVATGTDHFGSTFDGVSYLGSTNVVITGLSILTAGNWTYHTGASTTFNFPLYGISGVLTVPAGVPEPSALALLGSALLALGLARFRGIRK